VAVYDFDAILRVVDYDRLWSRVYSAPRTEY